jgi:hypothetical protein
MRNSRWIRRAVDPASLLQPALPSSRHVKLQYTRIALKGWPAAATFQHTKHTYRLAPARHARCQLRNCEPACRSMAPA